jgi:glycosidase
MRLMARARVTRRSFRKSLLASGFVLTLPIIVIAQAPQVTKVEPPGWWANHSVNRRPEFPRFYKQLIALRKQHEALRAGSVQWVQNSDESRVISYLRRAGRRRSSGCDQLFKSTVCWLARNRKRTSVSGHNTGCRTAFAARCACA